MLTVGEWAVLVKICLDAAVEGSVPRYPLAYMGMAEMDTLTDVEGIGGFYPLCHRCYKEINVACECPVDENEGDQVSSLQLFPETFSLMTGHVPCGQCTQGADGMLQPFTPAEFPSRGFASCAFR